MPNCAASLVSLCLTKRKLYSTDISNKRLSDTQEKKSPSRGLLAMQRATFVELIDIFSLPFAYAEAMAGQAGVYSRTHPPGDDDRFGKRKPTIK
jgi:hypothetical protein